MKLTKIHTLAASLLAIPTIASAGEIDVPALTDPIVPMSDGGSILGSAVSGSLSLDYNSHFISYGADVWGAGAGAGVVAGAGAGVVASPAGDSGP